MSELTLNLTLVPTHCTNFSDADQWPWHYCSDYMHYMILCDLFFLYFFRYGCFQALRQGIEHNEPGGLDKFTRAYEDFGPHVQPDGSVEWKEWCPGAKELYIWGDFSKNLFFHSIKVNVQKLTTAPSE